MAQTKNTCPYCGVGCGVLIDHDGVRITGVRGDPEHPANQGRLCSKGSTLHLTASPAVNAQARLLQPLHRPQRGGPTLAMDWAPAMHRIAEQMLTIIARDGADAIGFYVSGQLLTEDYYAFNKLVKGLLGTNHIDTNSRLCMSSAVAGYKLTLGADAPPACYDDLALADCVFIAGANPAWAHPILFRRLEDARRARPGQRWIVVDPRRTETAAMADLHLALRPGTDIDLFNGLLHVLLAEDLHNAAFIAEHTAGFEAVAARVRDATPARTASATGLPEQDILQAARWFGASPATLSLYCQGLNQSQAGTAKNAALINLHLATGQIGRPGSGPLSLTGQPNAMGGREVGGLANLLSAHRDLANAQHRAEVAALWGVDQVPAQPGRTAVEMFEAAADGAVKALWIACTNPAQSMPNQAMVRRALARAELVVVQEAFASTATARLADWLLPATTWGEKDGTVTNSERRISRVLPAVRAPGQARHDWAIAVDLGQRLEARLRPGRPTLFPYDSAEAIWCEHRESTRGRDLDITGLSYAMLEREGPQQWPMPAGARSGTARLYADGRFATADGRARFFDAWPEVLADATDAAFPTSLITGRLRDQWHGASRTGTLGRLFGHQPLPTLDLPPGELAALGLSQGDLVAVRSRRGALVVPVAATDSLAPGQAHIAMHWGDDLLSGRDADGLPYRGVNGLTTAAYCPRSHQPELKHTAVRITPIALPWRLTAAAWLAEDQALALRSALVDWLPRFGYGCAVPFGHEGHGVLLRLACAAPPPPDALQTLMQTLTGLFALDADPARLMRYDDAALGHHRRLLTRTQAGSEQLRALLLVGDARSEAWLLPWLQQAQPVQALGALLLMPGERPPIALAPSSPQICTCMNVDAARIHAAMAASAGGAPQRLAAAQQQTGCGTQCGSCLPTLRRLAEAAEADSAAGAPDQALASALARGQQAADLGGRPVSPAAAQTA